MKIRSDLIKEVSEINRFSSVTDHTDESQGVIRLESVILSYEKGSRTKRYLSPGAGKSYLTLRCTMINKATGKKIFEGDFEGEVAAGFLGGSSQQCL